MGFYSGICQQSRSISFIFLGENVCDNCINYLIEHTVICCISSQDQSIDVQLHLRIMKYVMSNLKSTNSLVRLSTQLCMSGSKSFTCKSINHIMSIYGLSKFQVNNYDSWITIKKKIINVSESNVKDGSRKAAGNIIDLMTMRENYEFSHDELNDMLKNVCIFI